jgi:hypothetical protein
MPSPRRNLAALMLAATLLTPGAASAAPLSPVGLRAASPALLTRFWSLLTVLWAEEGCILDPSGGRCAGAQSTAPAVPAFPEAGCLIDPNGGSCAGAQSTAPAPPAFLDEGCGIDPSGHCGSSH